ncbi:DUF6093 family protein [Agromyces sp. CF514]|uniref:DUF6093 family protein n=1 Tax=Agromyces sp. CF514 TaxID=1881031 RepID=UPI002100BD11|nr:DUF6093 family protein [Agromyces sp. CF514]
MSIVAGAQAWGQALAESLMVDTVLIRRKGPKVLNPSTGELEFTWSTIYSGKCRLVLRSGVVRDVDAQSQLLAVQGPRLDVPVAGTSGVRADDEFTITAGETAGVTGRVAGRFDQSLKSARRLPVEVWS